MSSEEEEVANWVALGVFLGAKVVFVLLQKFYRFRCTCVKGGRRSFFGALYRTKLLIVTVGIFSAFLLAVLAVLLLMDQGSVVREVDSQRVEWARWATYAVVHTMLAFVVGKWYWQKGESLFGFTFLAALYSLSWLFTVLSTEDRRWVWYAIGWSFFLAWLGTLVGRFKRNRHVDTSSLYVKLCISIVFLLYPVVLLLGPALLDEISQRTATWIYLAVDFFSVAVFLTSAVLLYSPDPADYLCCSSGECACKQQCTCHTSPYGTHIHHHSSSAPRASDNNNVIHLNLV